VSPRAPIATSHEAFMTFLHDGNEIEWAREVLIA
jgi:hypothetical protein